MSPRCKRSFTEQRIEDVAHGRSATLDGKNVEFSGRRFGPAHFFREVFVNDALGMDQHAIRGRVLVADNAVDQLVNEGVIVELEFVDCIFDCRLE